MRYRLHNAKLRALLRQQGHASVLEFCKTKKINRATLYSYLQGDGPLMEPYYQLCAALKVDPISLLEPVKVSLPEEIERLLRECENTQPDLAIGLFGSRAKGRAHPYSDWDFGVTQGAEPLSTERFLELKSAVDDFTEDFVHSVDLMNLDQAPQWFLASIKYEPLYMAGSLTAWHHFLGVLNGLKKAA